MERNEFNDSVGRRFYLPVYKVELEKGYNLMVREISGFSKKDAGYIY